MINKFIKQLVDYGIERNLVSEYDKSYTVNALLDVLKLDGYCEPENTEKAELCDVLEGICAYAEEKGIIDSGITERDLFDTRLMGILTPAPSVVINTFRDKYAKDAKSATDYFYTLEQDANYIRRDRIAKDMKWISPTEYGELDITINLSKPEKDPKAIAAAKLKAQVGYPKCMLCAENEGYAGRLDFPARQNHRTIPIKINNTDWKMQYSPYVYYNEHCIVFNSEHTPMCINADTFRKLLSFVEQFPHYFCGSNADLPIVGGSILSHDHFQGGNYTFAMAVAPIETPVVFDGFEDVKAGIVKWPMSVIRISSKDSARLVELGEKILNAWRGYTDEDAFILAETDGEPHNTITPIARMRDGEFELDLVLRNNITTEEHPLGVYHPHAELHHIKKENIGLIEVMGLAVLPARLKTELTAVVDAIKNGRDLYADESTAKHAEWAEKIIAEHPELNANNADEIIKSEVGKVFAKVLEHAGVYARTEKGKNDFLRFVNYVGGNRI